MPIIVPRSGTATISPNGVTRFGLGIGGAVVILGGVVSLVGIANPRREVPCADCPGGSFAGAPVEAGRSRLPELTPPTREPEPHAA